jgi:hypothetical protein
MRHDTTFSVRYLTDDPVAIRDIIESLQGVETILGEMANMLPQFVDGLLVQKIEVRVRELAQESPLRELFLVALFLAFQQDLEREVTGNIESLTGYDIPSNLDTIVTVLALILVFYGVAAIKDLVVGKVAAGPSERMLEGLIGELAIDTGKSAEYIRERLDARYGDKTLWKRIANATSRFFGPSKRQHSAPIEVNQRPIDHETVQDVPAQYLVDRESDDRPTRPFSNVALELHAQDKDNAGKGWAAVPRGITDQRLRLKLMPEVTPSEVWGHNIVHGDITIVYERIGLDMVPKIIQLDRVLGAE